MEAAVQTERKEQLPQSLSCAKKATNWRIQEAI